MFRYWDGSSWSEQTTSDPSSPAPGAPVPPPAPAPPTQVTPSAYPQQPADPYQQQYQQQYAQPQPGQYGGGGYGGQGYPGAPGSSGGGSGNKVLLIALAVLLIAGLAVGGFFGVRALTDDDGDDSASDDTSQSEETDDESESPTDESESPTDETESPTDSPTDTGPTGAECTGGHPGGGQASGDGSISGGDLQLPPVQGYTALEPQLTTTFAFADGVAGVGKSIEEQWISLYAVGGLPKASGYSDLEASVDQVIDCMTASPNFYRGFSGREDLGREAIQVDGHDAYAVTSELRVEDPDIQVDGDYSKVIVVDTGDDEHFGLYVAVVPIGDQRLIDRLEAATAQLLVTD